MSVCKRGPTGFSPKTGKSLWYYYLMRYGSFVTQMTEWSVTWVKPFLNFLKWKMVFQLIDCSLDFCHILLAVLSGVLHFLMVWSMDSYSFHDFLNLFHCPQKRIHRAHIRHNLLQATHCHVNIYHNGYTIHVLPYFLVHMHIYVYIYTYTYIHRCVGIHMYMYIYIHIPWILSLLL